jgi:hypothetical protein
MIRRTYEDEAGNSVRFVKAGLKDNPWIDAQYAARLQALPEKLQRAFLHGDWSSFEGAMFPELDEDRHRVPPMALPESWRRYAGIDWGWSSPWAVIWLCQDPDSKRLWLFREIYETQVRDDEQARRILAAEGDEHVTRIADSALWQIQGAGTSTAEAYQRAGCYISPSGKGGGSRVAGWARIREFLAEAPACQYHLAIGWKTCPRLHVSRTLTAWWSEMTGLSHAITGNVEDSDPRAPDHLADATRYVISALGTGPSFPILDDHEPQAGDLNDFGIPILRPLGQFAVMPDPYDEWESGPGLFAEDDIERRIVRTADDAREARRAARF